jgi:hypothetical protein
MTSYDPDKQTAWNRIVVNYVTGDGEFSSHVYGLEKVTIRVVFGTSTGAGVVCEFLRS